MQQIEPERQENRFLESCLVPKGRCKYEIQLRTVLASGIVFGVSVFYRIQGSELLKVSLNANPIQLIVCLSCRVCSSLKCSSYTASFILYSIHLIVIRNVYMAQARSSGIPNSTDTAHLRTWQKNFRSLSPNIISQVNRAQKDDMVVACSHKIRLADIERGVYAHLGIVLVDSELRFPEQIVPPTEVGNYSKRNRQGREIVHRDEPKIEKTWSIETPNYGDWTKGTHSIDFSRDVYQRSYEHPRDLSIRIDHLAHDIRADVHVFKFTVDEVLNRTISSFPDDLLFNINLLQENIGNHGVFESDATHEEYLRTLYVHWEILPVGERDETFTRILSGVRSSDPRVHAQLKERYEYLQSLRPTSFIRGTNGFRNYFGAMFADNLVIFENIDYGNAIYVMYENWQELSQKSRVELLASQQSFKRIVHTRHWKQRLRAEIKKTP